MNRITLCAVLALTLTGCITRPIVQTPPARCASLIPQSWATGVEAAPVPDNASGLAEWIGKPLTAAVAAAIIAPWASGYVAMSGQLEKSNGRTADTVSIVTQCEELVNEARTGTP